MPTVARLQTINARAEQREQYYVALETRCEELNAKGMYIEH